jgi:hypothetical protein
MLIKSPLAPFFKGREINSIEAILVRRRTFFFEKYAKGRKGLRGF